MIDLIDFSNIQLLIIFLSGIIYIGLGSLVPVSGFFPKIIAGMVVAALPIAALVNFNANLAHQFQIVLFFVSLVISFIFFIYFLKSNLKTKNLDKIKIPVSLILLGLILIFLNNPLDVYLSNELGKTILKYNTHDGYFASMMLELSQASYDTRLRIFDLYPAEWSKYHFMNIMTLSTLVAPQSSVGLFDFYAARMIVFVFFILAIIEKIIILSDDNKKSIAVIGLFLLLLFSWYYPTAHWNFYSTGAVTVISVTLFAFSFSQNNKNQNAIPESLFWILVLSVAAIRTIPIGLSVFFIMLILYYKELLTTKNKDRVSLVFVTMFVLFYIAVTVLMGEVNLEATRGKFFSHLYYDAWMRISVFHNGWGFTLKSIGYNLFYPIDQRFTSNPAVLNNTISLSWFAIMTLFLLPVVATFFGKEENNKKNIAITLILILFIFSIFYAHNVLEIRKHFLVILLPILFILLSPSRNILINMVFVLSAYAVYIILPTHIGKPAFFSVEWFLLAITLLWILSQSLLKISTILISFSIFMLISNFSLFQPWTLVTQDIKNDRLNKKIVLQQDILKSMNQNKKHEFWCTSKQINEVIGAHAMVSGVRLAWKANTKGLMNLRFLPVSERNRLLKKKLFCDDIKY
jgi:hypothetical protein